MRGRFFADVVGKADTGYLEHGLFSGPAGSRASPTKPPGVDAASLEEPPVKKQRTPANFDISKSVFAYERELETFKGAVAKKNVATLEMLAKVDAMTDMPDDVVLQRFKDILRVRRKVYNQAIAEDTSADEQEKKITSLFDGRSRRSLGVSGFGVFM